METMETQSFVVVVSLSAKEIDVVDGDFDDDNGDDGDSFFFFGSVNLFFSGFDCALEQVATGERTLK